MAQTLYLRPNPTPEDQEQWDYEAKKEHELNMLKVRPLVCAPASLCVNRAPLLREPHIAVATPPCNELLGAQL
jgi:hypothetical protein